MLVVSKSSSLILRVAAYLPVKEIKVRSNMGTGVGKDLVRHLFAYEYWRK